ncbi:MAG: DUF2294 domain-containing protein [Clostridiales bacterium]|nr:DUF2294 domain-containing protein [Clostridiales bacterium]
MPEKELLEKTHMGDKTKGQVEAQIGEAIIKFEKEYMGRGPAETKTYIIKDMVFVRLKGVLTQAEEQLAKTVEGAALIKKTRMRLLESARFMLETIISDITGSQVQSMHTDISTKTGERVIFTLNKNLEETFSEKD